MRKRNPKGYKIKVAGVGKFTWKINKREDKSRYTEHPDHGYPMNMQDPYKSYLESENDLLDAHKYYRYYRC